MEKAGGQVLFWNGHRVMGVLAMSRAIGDHGLRPYIIPEPEVRRVGNPCALCSRFRGVSLTCCTVSSRLTRTLYRSLSICHVYHACCMCCLIATR